MKISFVLLKQRNSNAAIPYAMAIRCNTPNIRKFEISVLKGNRFNARPIKKINPTRFNIFLIANREILLSYFLNE
jgi:hypothetical protein